MAVGNSKVKHFVGGASVPASGLTAGALYYAKQTDGQYVIYLAEDATTAHRITTLIDSAPATNGSGVIAKGDSIVQALGRLQGRIASLETDAASMFSIKGTLGTGGTITDIVGGVPKNGTTSVGVGRGDAYRVTEAGTYNGIECEVNDWIICSALGSGSTQNTWVVLQGNIELSGVTGTYNSSTREIMIQGAGLDIVIELPQASTSADGLMTTSQVSKLNGIASGAEVNQNAFAKVTVGSTTITADAKQDALTLVGSNVTLTPDATNDKVTIGITKANVTSALGYTPLQNHQDISGKLDKSGGTMTGALTIESTAYDPANDDYALDIPQGGAHFEDLVVENVILGKIQSASSADSATTATSAGSATKATQDSSGQQINTTYIKGLSVSGTTITYTKGDGTTGTITTQDTNTDTKVTAVGNHYAPAADTSAALSADASSSTAATWGTTALVTGVNLQRDAKGHVTGVTVDSIKMPANPNSWRGIQNTLTSTSTTDSLAAAQGKALNDKITTIDSALTWGSF